MKKKLPKILIMSLVLFWAFVCYNESNKVVLNREIKNTQSHTEADINMAMDIIIDNFNINFTGCTLTDIVYDENQERDLEDFLEKKHNSKEAIVILIDYKTGFRPHKTMNANSIYTNYQWMMVKDSEDKWEIVSQGY